MATQFRAGRSSLWQQRLAKVLLYQGPVLTVVGIALFVPLVLAAWDARGLPPWREIYSFVIPAIVGIGSGLLIRWQSADFTTPLSTNEALLVTTAAWWTTGLLAAIPFILLLGTPSLDALFESISGFTTAGTTMLTQLDTLPRSILLWRSIIQWLGGLGILLIVLIVGRAQGNNALSLLSAEGVKVSSGRLSLNFKQAAYRFIVIYVLLTVAQMILTRLLGMSLFDAVLHAMTTVSTGGFSPHDESIAFYRNHAEQYPLFAWIESVIIVFMIAGGVNFYVLYRLGRRQISALWDGLEMRLLWAVIGITTLIVMVNSLVTFGGGMADWFLRSLFEIASIISTTGYETTATGSFPRLSKELFLLLMIIGGCAGSTAGGIKLIRLGLLSRFLGYEVRNLRSSSHAIHVPTIDGQPVRDQAFRQVVFILILWLLYIAIGGLIVTYLAPDLPIVDAYSTVFTAIGVFGPSFIPVDAVIALPDLAKVIFIVGMLAGRLEILPLLVFFNINAWRR